MDRISNMIKATIPNNIPNPWVIPLAISSFLEYWLLFFIVYHSPFIL